MSINKRGEKVEVIDTITADQIEEGDRILYKNDPVEVSETVDETSVILVRGESHLSGDKVTYLLPPDTVVELWVP